MQVETNTAKYMKLQRAVKRRWKVKNRPVTVDGRLEDRQVCVVEAAR